jgi:capsular exopolysaccharide synthesis family protein
VAAASKPQGSGGWFGAARDLYERTLAGYRNLGKPAQRDRAVLSREAVVGGFMGSVQVAQVPNSRLVRVTVTSANPEYAARVANGVARTFIAMSLERRNESSGYAETFLQDQIKATKAKLEESERALNAYARANSILMLDDKTNVLNQTFSDTSAALAQAQRDRQKAEAIYNEVQRNPESAQQVLESKTIQTYKEQKAKLEAEYLTNLSLFKPEFPKMQQLKAQIAEIDARIKAETQVVLTAVKAQYEAAKRQEEQIRASAGQTKQEVLISQDKAVQLNLLRREVDTNRELYNGLLQRLKEVGVTSKVTANPISIVDAATPPLFPFEPNVRNIAMVGLMGGLLLGLAWAFIREYMDDSVKRTEQIEQEFGLPLLGLIPQVSRKDLAKVDSPWRLIVEDPRGMLAEAYRSMRTALQFSTAEGAPRQILVTSTSEGEGKSTTALALAINFAQLGKRVLLVDADMRNPSLHKSLGVPNDRGLSNYLAGEGARDQLVHDTEVPGLSLLTAGPTPPSPADLLMGPRFLRLLEKSSEMGYDQLIVDGPPVLGIADAIVLGNQIPNVIFVVQAGRTRKSNIRNALRRMRLAGLMPLGVALTRLTAEHGHGGAYGGYGYGYGYGYGNASQGAGSAQRLNTARED